MMNIDYAEMLREDMLFDKMSLVFENDVLVKIQDPMDSDDIPEGRFGEFPVKRIKTKLGVSVYIPLTRISFSLEKAEADIDTELIYRLCTHNRLLSFQKLTIEEALATKEQYCRSEELIYWKEKQADEGILEWAGFFDTPEYGKMLGITSMINGSGRFAYNLTYAGIGNFTDIRMEKNEVLNPIYRRVTR